MSYELKDHLGNVRAKMSLNTESITYFADYYPFGSVMQEGNAGERGKYGYQGDFAEKDPETGRGAQPGIILRPGSMIQSLVGG